MSYICYICNVEIPACSIAIVLTKKTGTCIPNMLCAYDVQVNEILIAQNPQLIMLLTIQLKNEIKPDHVPVTFINFSNDPVQLTKNIQVGSLQLYTELLR